MRNIVSSLLSRGSPTSQSSSDRISCISPIVIFLLLHHRSHWETFSKPQSSRFRDRVIVIEVAHTDVAALNGSLGGTETQTNILIPSSAALARSGALGLGLGVEEDVRLLLESTLRLDSQLGRPDI